MVLTMALCCLVSLKILYTFHPTLAYFISEKIIHYTHIDLNTIVNSMLASHILRIQKNDAC